MAALVLAACGGTTSDTTTSSVLPPVSTTATTMTTTTTAPTTTTTEPVQEAGASPQLAAIRAAIARSAEVVSGRMEGSIEISGIGGDASVTVTMPFGGAFDTATGNSSFFMDMTSFAEVGVAAGEEIPAEFMDLFGEMEIRVVDGVEYVKFPFFAMFLGAETPWISSPADDANDLASDFMFFQPGSPSDVLSHLEDANATVTEIGRETVNGVETTHFQVLFDTAAMLADASPEERAELEAQGVFPDGQLPMDIWVSDDGLIIRYVMDVDATALASAGEDEFQRMIVTFDLLDLNQPVDIVAPDPSEVTDAEALGAGFFGSSDG
ncbi:MAG: hypothetical protein R3246_01805 [Acidimicrobiia bacterium]|nr:hypothetical protein [Acidimicrobiia bacterium]